jgi:hypothetical protein
MRRSSVAAGPPEAELQSYALLGECAAPALLMAGSQSSHVSAVKRSFVDDRTWQTTAADGYPAALTCAARTSTLTCSVSSALMALNSGLVFTE